MTWRSGQEESCLCSREEQQFDVLRPFTALAMMSSKYTREHSQCRLRSTRSISLLKVAGALHSPNSITHHC